MYLVSPADNSDAALALVGGKASSLFQLIKHKFSVPETLVVSTNTHAEYLLTGKIPLEVQNEIEMAVKTYEVTHFAIRSSAVVEDGKLAAWAGQFESYLNVPAACVMGVIEMCFQSAQSERVLAYADVQGVSDIRMAVILQPMIPVRVGGVLFTHHPVTGSDEIVIEVVDGSGDKLVKGEVTPESLIISRSTNDFSEISSSLLSQSELRELLFLGLSIEKMFGVPQDIEWGVGPSGVCVFQSRPITTLH